MKKILYGMMAATMIFATSCENELEVGAAGEESVVSFTIATPDMGSRADYSDGTTATVLQYAVYDAAGNELEDLTVTDDDDVEINGSTTVNLKLTTGNTYSVIFWAAAPNAPYTVDFGAKTMTVDYTNAVSNDEARDAFYAKETFTVTGAQTETITLKRPFAQLNIGTNDYAASTSAGYTPTQSAVTVKNLKNTLNFFDGTVTGDDEARVFASAAIPAGQEFPVAGYEYLAMNYLLVGADKTVVDVEFTYTDGSDAKTRTVGSVPVQRNYRTNIYGQLLTSDVDVNVEIKPEYNEPAHELAALQNAALNGGEVTLTEDVVLTTPLEVQANMVINLNGKTISSEIHKSVGAVIKNNGNLTINGGTISSLGNNGGSAIANYGNLTINEVTINGAPREGNSWPAYPINNYGDMILTNAVVSGYQGCVALNAAGTTVLNNCELTKNYEETSSHVFYVNHADAKVIVNGGTYNHNGFDGSLAYVNKGEVVINDGTFNAKDGGYGFAALSNGKVTINGGNINAGLLNWGGQFIVKGGVFTTQPNANFIAAGFKAIKKDGKYYVVAESTEAVASTAAELTAALDGDSKEIYLSAGEYTMPAGSKFSSDNVLTCAPGTVFTGNSKLNINGATIIGATFSNPTGTAVDQTINGSFKGCKFEGSNAARWCYAGETVVFEDCEFSGSVYGVHFDGGANDVIFRNCTLSGFNALAGEVSMVTFEGCTFKGNGKSGYNGANLWGSAKMVNCEFTFDGTTGNEWIDCIGAGNTYEFVNCTVNGVAFTPENYTTFGDKIFSRNHVTVKINGADCAM